MHQSKSNDHVQTLKKLFYVYYQVMQLKSKIILHTTNTQCFVKVQKLNSFFFVTILLVFVKKIKL